LGFHWLGLGYINATKAVLTLSMLTGAIGAYIYGDFFVRNKIGALFSGLSYLISPYLLIVIYERGAVAE